VSASPVEHRGAHLFEILDELGEKAQLDELSARWDAAVRGGAGSDGERREVLQALHERFLERNYINNLLAGIERELEG